MEIQDRYNKAKGFVKLFNIADNVAYMLVMLHDQWTIPSNIDKHFKVQCQKDGETTNGWYFFAELGENPNGINAIFDALDFTVEFNKAVEERAKIYAEKSEILKNIIYTESIDKLKTLKFVFDESKKISKRSKKTKKKETETTVEPVEKTEITGSQTEQTNEVTEIVEPPIVEDNDDMMVLAKDLVGE
jgi:hypothetical protein